MSQVKNTAITAACLFVVDALVMNQGAISLVTAFVIIFWWLPKSALLMYRGVNPKVPLAKVAIYGMMVLAVFIANYVNNEIAERRAKDLIVVIENCRQITGRYPAGLGDLVPGYIPEVPSAKYTLISGKFWYINSGEVSPILFYMALPPFGRPTYSFDRQSWSYND